MSSSIAKAACCWITSLSVPWRETKFERAVNFAGALKGLFIHVEMIQPRRSAGRRGNDAQTPDPSFTTAQYDRLALIYTIASVRAGRWLVPAFHAAIDAHIRNGHDDPLNFNVQSFANSLDGLMQQLQGPKSQRNAPRLSCRATAMPRRRQLILRRHLRRNRPTANAPSRAPLPSKPKPPRHDRADRAASGRRK